MTVEIHNDGSVYADLPYKEIMTFIGYLITRKEFNKIPRYNSKNKTSV